MKRLLLYLFIIFSILATSCGPHRIQNRHKKHSQKYSRRIVKSRSKQYSRLRGRHGQSRHAKKSIKIKKFGGTYIIR